jgi:hypothetical protein
LQRRGQITQGQLCDGDDDVRGNELWHRLSGTLVVVVVVVVVVSGCGRCVDGCVDGIGGGDSADLSEAFAIAPSSRENGSEGRVKGTKRASIRGAITSFRVLQASAS